MRRGRQTNSSKPPYSGNSNPRDTVSITWKPDSDSYECHFPYNQTLIDIIKSKVPSNFRSYDADNHHAWYIAETYLDALLPIMKALFGSSRFNIIDKAKVEEYNQGSAFSYQEPIDKLVTEFTALVKIAVVGITEKGNFDAMILSEPHKYYRKAALFYHPDRKPEFAPQMSRLNQIWMELKKVEYFKEPTV